MNFIKNNVFAFVFAGIAGILLAYNTGCMPFDLGPRESTAQPVYSDPRLQANANIAANVARVGDVAQTIGQLPTPAQPFATAAGNFTDAYHNAVMSRFDQIEQRIQAGGKPVTQHELNITHFYAVLIGLSSLFIKTRKAQQLIYGGPVGPPAAPAQQQH